MQKKNLYLLFSLLLNLFFYAQNVGIGTTNPAATLDLNGNLRVRTLTDKTTDTSYKDVVVADANGNLGRWDKANMIAKIQDEILTNQKINYVSNLSTYGSEMKCDRFRLKFDVENNKVYPFISLSSDPAPVNSSTKVYYSYIHKTNASSFSFVSPNVLFMQQSVNITSSTWQKLDTNFNHNVLDEVYLSYPNTNVLYRITFLQRQSGDTQNGVTPYFYTITCEIF
ncbi:hypothetical protein [Chryseobacterium sp. RR2-3-20]|uniref:hypothetical protein n=1 Tax=Chryseobacterium sp. RR2-3-20 TaxID=2787626 RepID=UPI001AE0BAF0|nr:hypothetical protein [Chryseobacterium sp. RR2-3-20]